MQSSFAQTLWRRRQLGEIKIVEKVEEEDGVRPGMLHITIQVPHFMNLGVSGTQSSPIHERSSSELRTRHFA